MAERPLKKRRISFDEDESISSEDNANSSNGKFASVSDDDAADKSVDESLSEDQNLGPRAGTTLTQGKGSVTNGARAKSSGRGPRSAAERQQTHLDTFSLQVQELLKHVKPKYASLEPSLDQLWKPLKAAIISAPPVDPLSLMEAKTHMSELGIVIPFPKPEPPQDVKYKFSFSTPGKVTPVGGLTHRIVAKTESRYQFDVAVEMPQAMFHEKDYLDNRYFHKRAFYLAKISSTVRELWKDYIDLKFEFEDNNPYLPMLLIEPRQELKDHVLNQLGCTIRINPYVIDTKFPLHRLSPDRSCLRPQKKTEKEAEERDKTPFYNASVAKSLTVEKTSVLVGDRVANVPGFRDACMLGSVWLRQRGLDSTIARGGFGCSEWSLLIALLINTDSRLGGLSTMSTLNGHQIFRATMHWVVQSDLMKRPAVLGSSKHSPQASPGTPTIFSTSLNYNLLFKMTTWSYEALRREARTTLRMLNDGSSDAFAGCFIIRLDPPFLRHDYVTSINLPLPTRNSAVPHKGGEPRTLTYAKNIMGILRRGLGDRVLSLEANLEGFAPFGVDTVPNEGLESLISVGLDVNPSVALRRVDRGPAVDSGEEAEAFRAFWLAKAEQRRFKDGSVLEAVSWSATDSRLLLQEIISYLVRTHIGKEEADRITVKGNKLEDVLEEPNASVANFDHIVRAYGSLERNIRSIEDIPLQIRSIRPASSAMSYSARYVPFTTTSRSRDSIDVLVQFESSGRWPDDLAAIQTTKIAFLLKMSEFLDGRKETIDARVVLENQGFDILNQSFLELTTKNGASFRIRIHHERERVLIESPLSNTSINPKERRSIAAAFSDYKRTFEQRPTHVGAVRILAQRHLAFSPTARLLKAWFGAHLLSNHFAEELLDLVAARAFVHPFPWTTPNTAMAAFLRCLLFLSRWDWQHEPLIVDFNGDIKDADRGATLTKFHAWRQIDPAMNRVVIFAATNFDMEGIAWSEYKPKKVIAARMTSLASAAVKVVLAEGTNLHLDRLFKTSLKDYDFVLHLDSRFTAKEEQNGGYKNLQKGAQTEGREVSANLVSTFVEELETKYAEAMTLFYNRYGSDVICGVWNPTTSRRRWKTNTPFSTQPIENSDASINKSGILAEIGRIGGDLMTSVTAKA